MARGGSGRIVVEVEPSTKDELYATLALERLTLKAWFLREVDRYLGDHRQPSLFASGGAAGDTKEKR